MGRTSSLNLETKIQYALDEKSVEGINEGEADHEQPLSPLARVFREQNTNIHIIAIFGMKTLINLGIFKADLVHVIEKNYRFSSLQVISSD